MFISGIGSISARGTATESLEILKKDSEIRDRSIDKDALLSIKNKYDLRRADRYTAIVMASAVQACADAGLTDWVPADTGIIIASAFGPHRTTFAFLNDILDYPDDQVLPTTFSHSVHNAAASYVASSLQIRGPTISLSGFEDVWFDALELSDVFLNSGCCKRILLIGAEELALLTQSLPGILPDRFHSKFLEGSVALLLSSAPEGKNYTSISCSRQSSCGDTNRRKIELSFKITEGGFSNPPKKECRGLENPRSVEEGIHLDNYETISKTDSHSTGAVSNDFLGSAFQTAQGALDSSNQPGKTISINSISGILNFHKTV